MPVLAWRLLLMATSWFKRLRKWKARPAGRCRPARARLGVEALEAREVPTVQSFVDGAGVLQVSPGTSIDEVAIDHTVTSQGPTTLVNQQPFADFRFSSIHIQGGFTNVG